MLPEFYVVKSKVSARYLVSDCRRGYPLLAAFLDSDESFMIFRRFGYIQSRLLLEKQDQLRKLEAELEALDETQGARDQASLTTRDLRPELAEPRRAKMANLEKTFCEYGQSLVVIQRA